MNPKMLAKDRGFTLVEMMITVLIASVVLFSVFRVFTATNKSYRRGSESIDGQQNSRAALTWLARELRSAKSFSVINADEVTFISDVNVPNQIRTFRLDVADFDGDGDVTELLLIRNPADDGSAGPVTDEVAVGIQGLEFTYRDQNGAETAFRSAVQEVEVLVRARGSSTMREEDRGDEAQIREVEMTTRVRCRNLGKSVPTLGDVTPPAGPTGLAVSFGCGIATLSWVASPESDVSGYYLHYNVGGGPPYDGVDARQGPSPIFVGNGLTYTLTGLDLASTYGFNIQAVDGADNVSAYASQVTGKPTDTNAPSVPVNLAGRVISDDEIQLSWNVASEWDVTSYHVRYYPDGSPVSAVTDTTTDVVYVASSLTDDEIYHFSVSALDACGNESAMSSEITVVMQPCAEDTDFPDMPTNFAILPGDEFLLLSWTKVTDYDVVGYQVYMEEDGVSGGSTLLVGNVESYYVYGLQNGVDYSCQVAAVDGCGHVGGYTPLEVSQPFECAANSAPPSAPSNLDARDLGVGDEIRLSWTAGSEGDLLGYTVRWGTDPSALDGSVDAGNAVFRTIDGLLAGTTYHFAVVSRDVCGNESPMSATVAKMPTWGCACPPTLSITSPADLALLAGNVNFAASAVACSTATIEHVEFVIDGVTRFVDYSAPYEFNDSPYSWDTELETRGPHALAIIAVDDNNCETADSISVFIDNTLVGVACLGIEDGSEATIGGSFGEVLTLPITNLSTSHSFELQRMMFNWTTSGLTLLSISLEGSPIWSAASFPGASSGDTLDVYYPTLIPPDDVQSLSLSFWNNPYVAVPTFNFPAEAMTMSTFGNPGLQCGPYPILIDVNCSVGVTIASVNSTRVYNTVVDPPVGQVYYTDRTLKITSMPSSLLDSVLLRTPNDDKNLGDSHSLKVNVNANVTVWIAYDPRGTPPNWIKNTYVNSGLTIGVTDTGTSTLGLWKADFPASQITFSGNKGAGYGGAVNTNYVIFFTCR